MRASSGNARRLSGAPQPLWAVLAAVLRFIPYVGPSASPLRKERLDELDVFGRVRNLKEQALQEYLAVVETQRSTHISLVAQVAAVWVTLATDRALLKLARDFSSGCSAAHAATSDEQPTTTFP
jgi:hypothetical protein